MLWGKDMFPTYLLMKLQSYVRSIQEEEAEKGKEISLQKQLSQQPRVDFGIFLEYFKADLLNTLGTQVEFLKTKKIPEQQDQQVQAL